MLFSTYNTMEKHHKIFSCNLFRVDQYMDSFIMLKVSVKHKSS